ncbi:MAG: DUF4199 domain-containing protein [Aureispira sp.]
MNKISTRLGLMTGFIATLYITILYLVEPRLLIDGYERWTLVLFFGAIVYGVYQARPTTLNQRSLEALVNREAHKEELHQGDFKSFGELLQIGFRTFFIAFLIKFIFIYFLFNYYDPSLIEMVRDASTEIFKNNMDFSEDTQEIVEQRIANYRAGEFGPSLRDPLGIIIELLIGFFMAFLTALFMKREQPEY